MASLAIGRLIRTYGYSTNVNDDDLCASSCALAWLAGNARYMHLRAHIGFHATFTLDGNGNRSVASAGNAIVGAYLQEMGISPAMIGQLTEAAPNDIYWLQATDANQMAQLRVNVLSDTGIVSQPDPLPVTPPAVLTPPATPPASLLPPATTPPTPATPPPAEANDPFVLNPPVAPPAGGWNASAAWIQLASRDNLLDALSFARDLHKQYGHALGGYMFVLESKTATGWYVVAVAVPDRHQIENTIEHLFSQNMIPWDSRIATGRAYGHAVWSNFCLFNCPAE
jgi:hypothetical protein